MYISKIIIKGFRCFDADGVVFNSVNKMNVFIGHNSAGKTTAMEALLKLFGRTKSEREIKKTDFYRTVACSNLPDNSKLMIEAQLAFNESEDAIPLYFKSLIVDDNSEKAYIRIRLEATWKKDPRSIDGVVDSDTFYLLNPESDDSVNPIKSTLRSIDYSRIQMYYVPAVRKTSDELKYTSNSLLHRMLKLISFDEEFRSQALTTLKQVDDSIRQKDEFQKIKGKLVEKWNDFHRDSRYDDVEIGMLCDSVEHFLKKLEVTFSSNDSKGDVFQIDDLGDGYKSLFYLSMMCSLLESEREMKKEEELPSLSILAIEEPENHIAPHLLGKISKIFEKMSKNSFLQIFISSHSASLVGRVDPECIYHFFNVNSKASVHQIFLPEEKTEEYKFIKEAVRHWPEIYFAKLVVIGEGDSEGVIFKHLSEHLNVKFDENEITFFPLGHRFIHHIWKLLEQLNIPYITLLDLDRERPGGGWGRIKYVLQELALHGKCNDEFWNEAPKKLTADEIGCMHKWLFTELGHTAFNLDQWIHYLEKNDVFFSSPLDIDYLMLESFTSEYENILSACGDGPNIPEIEDGKKFEIYLNNAIRATLKGNGKDICPKYDGTTYNGVQKMLMIWYKYLFLGKGKPITHILHLPNIPDAVLKQNLESTVIKRIFDRIEGVVGG